jgi:hypothetical protein
VASAHGAGGSRFSGTGGGGHAGREVADGYAGGGAEGGNGGCELYGVVSRAFENKRVGEGDVLAISSGWHRPGAHARSESWIGPRPVVHWHFVSAMPQPELGMAATKQGICCLH